MKTLGFAVVCAIAALATLGTYAVSTWLPPAYPVVFGVIGVAVPVVAIVLALEPQAREAPFTGTILAALVALVLGVAVPAAWMAPKARIVAASKFADGAALRKALNDPHIDVRVAACRGLFRTGVTSSDMAAELSSHPDVATQCLDETEARHRSVASKVLNQWQDTLTFSKGESCELAEFAELLPATDEADVALGFLDCAVNAAAPGARACCVTSLKQMQATAKLAGWIAARPKEIVARQMSARLVLIAHNETQTLKDVGNNIRELGFAKPEVGFTTLVQACDAVVAGTGNQTVSSAVRWVVEQHEACLTPEEKEVDVNVVSACRVISGLSPSPDLDRQICTAGQVSRREKLQELREAAAASEQGFADLVDQISAGSNMRARGMDLEAFARDASGPDASARLKAYSPADLARIRAQIDSEQGTLPDRNAIQKQQKDNKAVLDAHRANPMLKGMFDAKSEADLAKVRAEFEERERKAGVRP